MDARLNISNVLKQGLAKLSMYDTDSESCKNGLKFVSNCHNETNNYIKLYLLEARDYDADAVYFKYFDNGRPPIPQIYIYEESKLKKDINILHKELWSSCKVPMFFVFSNTQIKIFNSLSKKEVRKQNIDPIKILSIASEIQNEFKAQMFDSGAFWNTVFAKNEFSYKHSAYNSLLDSLEVARDDLIMNQQKSISIINSLLIKSILLRYMEERGVFQGFFQKFSPGAESFKDICHDEKIMIEVFDYLSDHFNGGIFKLSDTEKNEIKNIDLRRFKFFVQGNVSQDSKQMHFWDLYSFKDLPIELISNIYELFLKAEDKKGVVYTPPILVNFMIDEMMPLDTPSRNFKILDPACGSGVFLVGAYKRLIQWWMIENSLDTPPVEVLKSLIRENIYGIDIKDEAVEVAKFSLSLSICDVLSPEAIWDQLHFDNLSSTGNLVARDFFEVLLEDNEQIRDFDLIIGNPPFVSEIETKASQDIEKAEKKNEDRPKLPDNQLALLFLEQSFKLVKKDKYVSMVQPSSVLYNNLSDPFKQYLFNKYNLKQVIDFSGIKNLFKRLSSKKNSNNGADVATSVLCLQNKDPQISNQVLHITVRQTLEAKEKIYFDFSYYDYHWVSYQEAIYNKYLWKCNLLGGSRVSKIISRFKEVETFKEYLQKKKEDHNWVFAEGYQEGKEGRKRQKAGYITGHMTLPPQAFSENGIDDSRLHIMEGTEFERPRKGDKDIFKPPHLLIKKQISNEKILSEIRDDYLTFRNTIYGIHVPEKDRDELVVIRNYFDKNSKFVLFYLAVTSSRALVYKATSLLQKDILDLPYTQEIPITRTDQYFIDDTLNYMVDWVKGNSNLSVFENVTPVQIEDYQKVFCELLNSAYDKFYSSEILETDQYIITSFYYKDKQKTPLIQSSSLDQDLENLIINQIGEDIHVKRILRLYDKNMIYIIKPKQLRFWMKSIAVRDADETFADLIRMRY